MRNDDGQSSGHFVLIATPGTKRANAFAEAARQVGHARIDVLSYPDALNGAGMPDAGTETLVRFDSPSGCAATARAILKAGIEPLEDVRGVPIGEREIDGLEFARGEMLHPRQWFLGFRQVLRRIEDLWRHLDVRWMSSAETIITAFDKLACLERWAADGLPVPRRYPPIKTYAQLRRENQERHARLFLKLRYGYSAMGAVALEWRGPLVRAITTVDVAWSLGRPRLFTTKRPRVLLNEFAISWLIDTLAMEEILVEEWLPKARWQGRPYDLRVVMIDGKVQHVIGRANASPFTNLNLDAQRVPRDVIEQQLGDSWNLLESGCEQACASLPGAGSLGLDVLVRPCRRKIAFLEANAFGDYLPGLLHQGRTTYEAELLAARKHQAHQSDTRKDPSSPALLPQRGEGRKPEMSA